jgi:outer membrane protein with beta-barrel domain
MKAPTLGLLSLLALGVAPAVQAEEGAAYYGVSIGELEYSESGGFIDDTVSSWRLSINYQFMEHLGVEGGYGQSGDIENTFTVPTFPIGTVDLNFHAEFSRIFTIRLLGIWPFDNGLSLMGGLGYSQQKFEFDLTDGTDSISGDEDLNTPGYYAAVQYDWERFAMRLGYEKLDFDDNGRDGTETMLTFFYKL